MLFKDVLNRQKKMQTSSNYNFFFLKFTESRGFSLGFIVFPEIVRGKLILLLTSSWSRLDAVVKNS